jgi:signal transduction histidine kinase
MAGENARTASEASGAQGMSVGGMLMLSVLPLLTLVVVLGGLLVWSLLATDTTNGFSMMEGLAIVVVLLVAVGVARSLWMIRRRTGFLVDRIGELTTTARRIAQQDLTLLGESLDDPDPSLAPIAPIELSRDAPFEVDELSRSLEELHGSLQEVAARQMATLKGGVSRLIVTLARRNATLVDSQLALLDELEVGERDPDVLGAYYMVDHYATRIRRNAESLLVLAGEPPPRVWPRSLEISEVVRAAVGEVDDYQRIEIVSLERAQVAGGAVADLAHLLAELLENATRFSPPGTPVKVKSVFDWDGYRLTITDRGPGLTNDKIKDLNRILKNPPSLGRVMEPTMGMYVVSKLAARHDMAVEIIPGIPGLTVQITIPSEILERNLADPPTLNRDFRRAHPTSGSQAVTEGRVVDLTDPVVAVAEGAADARHVREPSPLPVRSPGQALGEAMSPSHSVAEGESAVGIKEALAAYDQGRRAANPESPDDLATSNTSSREGNDE